MWMPSSPPPAHGSSPRAHHAAALVSRAPRGAASQLHARPRLRHDGVSECAQPARPGPTSSLVATGAAAGVGSWREALQPSPPFVWAADERRLLEIPVTTLPLFEVPIQMSRVLYASGFSRLAARLYIGTALGLCAWTGPRPSVLLHPPDLLGREDGIDALSFFAGVDSPLGHKVEVVGHTLDALARRRHFGTMLNTPTRCSPRVDCSRGCC